MTGIGRLKNKIAIEEVKTTSPDLSKTSPAKADEKKEQQPAFSSSLKSSPMPPQMPNEAKNDSPADETRRLIEEAQRKRAALKKERLASSIPTTPQPLSKKILPSFLAKNGAEEKKSTSQPGPSFPLKQKTSSVITPPPFREKYPPKNTVSGNKSLSAKDKLYQQILATSQKENLARQQFIARIEGESIPNQPIPGSNKNQGKVIFHPVPQKPSRAQKIVTRTLIVLLLISLGFLVYLIVHGYLI